MQWWNDFVEWVYSDEGWRVISTAVIPFVAIVVAGFIAALIGKGYARRIISLTERDRRTAAVTTLITAARRASKWNTLSVQEQQHADHLTHEADTRIRLLPLPGTAMAADWAAHEIAAMKKSSVSFSFQADQSLIEFRDRLVEWQARPGRAKKLFKSDLDSWAYESSIADKDLVQQQQEWAKQQVNETGPISTVTGSTVTGSASASLSPAKSSWTGASTPVTTSAEKAPLAPASAGTSTAATASAAAPAASTASAASTSSAGTPVASSVPPPAVPPPAVPLATAYALPASVGPATPAEPVQDWEKPADKAATADDATDTGETSSVASNAPGPISAGTVRQRIAPDDSQY